ncbi:DNA polymerase epsilon subunit 4 [Schistosoma japonicum]|uniref:DNA polymerase epsilon subunit 4 n=1 Tax=Schistosoma japonicum TaxID=6182 RepID=Q5DCN4_SCHJA|nr:SJCHGC04470 protein [Schistosoma japonicum]KAH8859697.1 DNA polymerase epsilon subunit 4 [Schistosoma japonicum]TNN07628.1 DNA polymerase epsilon subunit 4 [Schistosoma japonicum]
MNTLDEVSLTSENIGDPAKENHDIPATEKLIRLPLSRVKTIVKTVPAVSLVTSEALISVGFLCEQFIQEFCRSVIEVTLQEGKKTITKQHVQDTVNLVRKYEFLDGIIE